MEPEWHFLSEIIEQIWILSLQLIELTKY